MAGIEKISIALPTEMVAVVRQAVDVGDFASSSEVIRDALRDWTMKRRGIEGLRTMWERAVEDKTPGAPMDEVLDRLERKYKALADAAGQ